MDIAQMKSAIEESLLKFWNAHSVEVTQTSESIEDFVDPLDSLTAVEALIEIEKIVGMEIPEGRVIRRGGYDTRGQFIGDLTWRVLKYVEGQQK